MSTFVKGDVVQLKSGGPLMTISDIGDYSGGGFSVGPKDGVKCIWFDKDKPLEQVFDAAVLSKYED